MENGMKKIIPCLDMKEGRVVKGVKFRDMRDSGDPAEMAREYSEGGADELVLLDISASLEGRKTMIEVVKRVAEQSGVPFTVGGGIRGVEEAAAVLGAGADKVSVNTAAVDNPELINQLSERFGAESVVVAIDCKKEGNRWKVYIMGGTQRTDKDAVEWAREAEKRGAGALLPTSIDCDGMKTGYDVAVTKAISEACGIQVIASGGAGSKEDVLRVLTEGKADAALCASVFHFNKFSIRELKEFLAEKGVKVRL
ncbi:MAG: imidazole glycerol phosphate synthase subunit HisF [Candidatus Diapherotrites archaeon]